MRKTGSFGSAKPLPGQSGYKDTITSQLEKEAIEMENKLKMLQEQVQEQNEADQKRKSSSSGGTRWGGASKKKGSLTSYAKDVKDRHANTLSTTSKTGSSRKLKDPSIDPSKDPSKKATAAARRLERQSAAKGGFNSKDVEQWSVSDVGEWLSSMMLQEHVGQFASNAISGPILLDVSLEDLDYMGITVLAHRKVILKGIEDLRKNKRVTKQLFAPAASVAKHSSTDDEKLTTATQNPIDKDEAKKEKVHWSTLEPLRMKEVTGGEPLVNGADSDMLDEEAERRAFQEAVLQWRQGTCSHEKTGKSLLVGGDHASGSSGQWQNPFPSSTSSGTSLEQGSGEVLVVSARGRLAEGELDEEKERREFQAAVLAWRDRDKEPPLGRAADRLARQLDAMHEQSSAKLREDQESMLRKIEQSRRELESAKKSAEESALQLEDWEEDGDGHFGGGDGLSPCPSLDDSDAEEGQSEPHAARSFLEVELIESKVGNVQLGAVSVEYSVDEPPSDDED